MKYKYIHLYIDIAERISQMSSASRLKVGCVIVKENTILSYGWNGMPNGWDNECEHREYMDASAGGWVSPDEIEMRWPFVDNENKRYRLVTNAEVLHAESNALMKVARSTESCEGAILFCTHSPCIDCAKLIHQAGINSVYYRTQYRSTDGVEFLEKSGVTIFKV